MDDKEVKPIYYTDKVAILLATYQGEKYLREQLDSLLKQSYDQWMVFAHDDGSTDKTMDILQEYADEYSDSIIIIDGKKTGNAKNNFLYLMSMVSAPYYMCCDQDDVWLPEKIERTYLRMKETEEKHKDSPILVFTELHVVDEKLNIIADSLSKYQGLNCYRKSSRNIMIQNCVTGCTMMFNRKVCELCQRAKKSNAMIMHDWWCALIASEFGCLVFEEEPTILYRQHTDNTVGAKKVNSIKYLMKMLCDICEMKKSLLLTRQQAAAFCECYGIKSDNILFQYATIEKKNKIGRLVFYWKNGIKKSGLLRNIGFLLIG